MADSALDKKIKKNYDYLTDNTNDIYSLVDILGKRNALTNTQRGKILDETANPNDQLKAAMLYYFIGKSTQPDISEILLQTLIETHNYAAVHVIEPEALSIYSCSDVGGDRFNKFKLHKYQKKYLTHLEIVNSTIDIRSFVKDISEYSLLEEIRMINVQTNHVGDCTFPDEDGERSSILEHPVILKNLRHFECMLWFESKDKARYGKFIWPQEIFNLDTNRIIFFRKSEREKENTLEERLRNFFGLEYLELTVNNQILALAIRNQNLAITPIENGRIGNHFLPQAILTELKVLFQTGGKVMTNELSALISPKDFTALQICEGNPALKLRLLISLLTCTNPQDILKSVSNGSPMFDILKQTVLAVSSSSAQKFSLIPTVQQCLTLTHIHFNNIKVHDVTVFKDCTYLQSIIMEEVVIIDVNQFYKHIYFANLHTLHLNQLVDLEGATLLHYLRSSRAGDWRELLFSEKSLHYSDEYLDHRRLVQADIRLSINGQVFAFTDANHRIHVLSDEADKRDFVDKKDPYPNIDDCCKQTVDVKLLLERLRQNQFFSQREETAIQNCPPALITRVVYSIQAFTLRDTSIFVECLQASGNNTVASMFRPTTLEVHRETFEGVPPYRAAFLADLSLTGVYMDWKDFPTMLAPCISLKSIKLNEVNIHYTEHIVSRCVLPALKYFEMDGSVWIESAADLKALLFFDPIPGRSWRIDEIWKLGIDMQLKLRGKTNLIIDHVGAELTIGHMQHSADDIYKSVNVALTKLMLTAVNLQLPGPMPKTHALNTLRLHQSDLRSLDVYIAGCPQLVTLTCGLPDKMEFDHSWHQVTEKNLRRLDLASLPRSLDSLTLLATQLTAKGKISSPIQVKNVYMWATELKKVSNFEKYVQAENVFLFEQGTSVTDRAYTSPKLLTSFMNMPKCRQIFYGRVDGYAYDKKFIAFMKQFGMKGDEFGFILTKTLSGQWTSEVVTNHILDETHKMYIRQPFED